MPQIDDDAIIESDKELVRIVLENLIDNAIKFYNDSDRVNSFVKIHINSMPKGGVIVRVIDNGIGISESSPGKLFQMFSRASERSETGGIGLYITKDCHGKDRRQGRPAHHPGRIYGVLCHLPGLSL